MSFELVKGNLAPAMPLTITSDGSAVDLSGADTVELSWIKPDGTETLTTLTPVNAALGQFRMDWTDGDTDQVGPHLGLVIVTTSSVPQTYPSDGTKIIWWVNPALTCD